MNLQLPKGLARGYKSKAQMARVVTEAWGQQNLFCVSCDSPSVDRAPNNAKAVDYTCPLCAAGYQLKASAKPIGRKVQDAGYEPMIQAIRSERCPHLLVLQYTHEWRVQNLLMVPAFCMTPQIVEKRRPLRATARRAGWVGCNILLGEVPPDSRVPFVTEGEPRRRMTVRQRYARLLGLASMPIVERSWALEVLSCIRKIGREDFTIADVYAFEGKLAATYPNNRHIREKMRQQLQVLRDKNLITFLGGGKYRVESLSALGSGNHQHSD